MARSASTGESPRETRTVAIDAEVLAGRRFAYQEDLSLVEDIDLLAATPRARHQLVGGHHSAV